MDVVRFRLYHRLVVAALHRGSNETQAQWPGSSSETTSARQARFDILQNNLECALRRTPGSPFHEGKLNSSSSRWQERQQEPDAFSALLADRLAAIECSRDEIVEIARRALVELALTLEQLAAAQARFDVTRTA